MFAIFTLLACLISSVLGLPNVTSTEYYTNLASSLNAAGLNSFLNALVVANTTQTGQKLISALYSDGQFTIYAPVDSAWQQSGLTDPAADQNLVSLLAYHIVTATVNSSDVADPRQHTIALTALRTDDMKLPGDQTQVIVLETAPNTTENGTPQILTRGDTYNATSVSGELVYQNLIIQPIDKILAIPSDLLKTLSSPYLALTAMSGTPEFINFASSLNFNGTLQNCDGCTFFVPVDTAFTTILSQVSGLNSTQKTNLLENHILNGTVAYSPRINVGSSFVTAAGETLVFADNSTGRYLTTGTTAAKILRADIPVSNGVVHLIDTVLLNTDSNEARAQEAVSSASNAATGTLGGVTGTIGIANATRTSTNPSHPASASSSGGAGEARWNVDSATKFALLSVVLGALWA